MPLDVERRIGLRIAEPLRVLQAVGKRQALLLHAGEDVIAGAVEDAVDARELVADEALAQRLDDRNAARDRGLEIQRHVIALGERRELHAMLRKQRLVGGHHMLAGLERGLDRAFGGVAGAADQFDEHIDAGVARERERIAEPSAIS